MPTTPPSVRPATAADVPGIAEVHVRAWQRAYAGIVPAAYLDSLDPGVRAEQLARRFGPDAVAGTVPTLVATGAEGTVLGFVNAGPYRDDDVPADGPGWGEIYAIYVHPGHWTRGAGRALFDAALGTLDADRTVALWVLEANSNARRFYERMGLRPDGATNVFEIAGAAIPEIRYRRDPVT
ncbi:GNAT family N-acetyltransferase [Occultella glacieicola]|uniref:GNAT family N-acetyltransferase n=1 Tax=Occultella glacieicola TaxID=2518684 RepID=A0ABY2E6T1_9MICO|nr:GNAT family N-acetyltransferase [Occultella glacieicola]TDE95773.1 GNAT family N-acetyltransferase [Occultella glacieicola]